MDTLKKYQGKIYKSKYLEEILNTFSVLNVFLKIIILKNWSFDTISMIMKHL